MADIKELSIEELEEELALRLEQKKKEEAPQVLKEIDWQKVIDLAVERRDEIVGGSYHEDNDDSQYIFEEVMQAVFGGDYFEWENEQTY